MQSVSRGAATRAVDALGWLLGATVFAYLLAFPRVLGRADESVVLYGAKRVLQGQALYKDIFEFITPVTFYAFAAVFAVAGPSLVAARVVMAAVNACSCVLLFWLARRVAGTAEAVLAVLLFAVICLPIWPYTSPHWLSTALCLATAAALLAGDSLSTSRPRALAVGVLAGLTFCVQQQRGVFLGLWVVAAVCALAWCEPGVDRWQRGRRVLAAVAAGGLAVTCIVLGYSVWRASIRDVVYATFLFVFHSYYPANHGPDIAGNMPWAGVCFLCGGFVPYTWRTLLRGVPAVLAIEAFWLLWTLRRRRDRDTGLRLCVLMLAVAMALAILYYPDFIHVAFIAPFALIVAARLVHAAGSLGEWQRARGFRMASALGTAAVTAAVLYKGWANLEYAWTQAPVRFDSAMGSLRGTVAEQQLLEGVRGVLDHSGAATRTLFTYPDDAWLYLAAPAENPTPFALLYQGYNAPEQIDSAVAALEHAPPECLVMNTAMLRDADPVMRFQAGRYRQVTKLGPYEIYGRNH